MKMASQEWNSSYQTLELHEEIDVLVTNIVSADEIYVQSLELHDMLLKLHECTANYGGSPNYGLIKRPLEAGEPVLVHCSTNDLWLRAKVLSDDRNEARFELVDSKVELSCKSDFNVKPMPNFLKQFPSFAIRCRLSEIPSSPEDRYVITQLVKEFFVGSSGKLRMTPIEATPDGYTVNFTIPNWTGVKEDWSFSLEDFIYTIKSGQMIGSSRASKCEHFTHRNTSEPVIRCREKVKVIRLINQKDFSFIAHNQDPIRLKEFENLRHQMNIFYSDMATNLSVIRVWPFKVGQVIVVKYIEEGMTHFFRGRIEFSDHSDGHLDVYLVDYGLSVKVHWSNIWKLSDHFIQYREVGLNCSLWLQPFKDLSPEAPAVFQSMLNEVFFVALEKVVGVSHFKVSLMHVQTKKKVIEQIQTVPVSHLSKLKISSDSPTNLEDTSTQNGAPEPGYSRVTCTHCESPSAIYIRNNELQSNYQNEERRMREILYQSQKEGKHKKESHLIKEGQSVTVTKSHVVYRGRVETIDQESKMCKVKLVDFGRRMEVHLNDLALLPQELRLRNQFCLCIKLGGIRPTGSNPNEWTFSAIDRLKELIKEKQLFVKQVASEILTEDGEKKVLMELFELRKIADGPFEKLRKEMINLGQVLVDEGLALKERQPGQDEDMSDEMPLSQMDVFSMCGSSVLEGEPDFCDPSMNWFNLDCDTSDWPSPRLPSSSEFYGKITFIDDEGQFYIQPKPAVAEAVGKILTLKHEKMKSNPTDLFFLPGDKVIAKYPGDSSGWYRGKVVEVKENQVISILFVDYGDVHDVQPWKNECHKSVDFEELPIQCIRCMPDRIAPIGGRYDTNFLDEIHPEFVESFVKVKISRHLLSQTIKFPLPTILHILSSVDNSDKGVNVARYFVQKGAAVPIGNHEEWCPPEVFERCDIAGHSIHPVPPDSESSRLYGTSVAQIEIALGTLGGHPGYRTIFSTAGFLFPFPVRLLEFHNEQTVFVKPSSGHPLTDDSSDLNLYKSFYEECEAEFEILSKDLQEISSGCQNISNPEPEMACLARFSWNKTWYRAKILRVHDTQQQVDVFYVDYGNFETLPLSELREIPIALRVLVEQGFTVMIDSPIQDGPQKIREFLEALKKIDQAEKLMVCFRETGQHELFIRQDEDFFPVSESTMKKVNN